MLEHVIKKKMRRGIERFPFEGPDPSKAYTNGWRLASAAVLERYPVIVPEPPAFEASYLRGKFHAQNSWSRPISEEWFKDQGIEGSDRWKKEDELAKLFIPAERTTQADKDDNRKSLERALDQKLYFIIKRTEKSKHWQFPQQLIENDETKMKETAENALKAVVPIKNRPQWYWWNYTPSCHLEHVYPKWFQEKHDVYGIMILFYRAQLIKGEIEGLRHGSDYLWVTTKELPEYLSAEYYQAIQPFLYYSP